ncbi:MAG: hypothetical protein ACRDPY_15160 [Streptosporangiaceae bacterium]
MAYVVVMRESRKAWGPFDNREDAQRFAGFVTQEVDPCDVELLCSPHLELLNWRDNIARGDTDPWSGDTPLTAEQSSPSRPSEGVRIMRGGKVLTRIWPPNAYRLARDLIAAAVATEEEPPFL